MANVKFSNFLPERFEQFDRWCSICGAKIKAGDFIHRCSKRYLNKLDQESESEQEIEESQKTFEEKLEDAQAMYDFDTDI